MVLTDVGKLLRKKRIEKGELLYHMAKKLGIGSAQLSSIETGKQKLTRDQANFIIGEYRLNYSEAEFLRNNSTSIFD